MKSLSQDAIMLSVLLVMYCIGKDTYLLLCTLLVCIIWVIRNRDVSIVVVVCLLGILTIPRFNKDMPLIKEAKVISVSKSSAILHSGFTRFTVYTDDMLIPDAVYSFDASFVSLQSSSHFFNSSYVDYLHTKGVYWQYDGSPLQLVKTNTTLRSILFEKIMETESKQRTILLRTVLNIKEDDSEYSWLDLYGFSFSGILLVVDGLCRYLLDQKKRTVTRIILEVFLYFSFGYPLIILLHMCKDILTLSVKDRYVVCGWSLILPLLADPYAYRSIGYVITGVYRICSLCIKDKTVWPYCVTLCVSSLLYGVSYPVLNLLYRKIMVLSGMLWVCNVIHVIFNLPLYLPFYTGVEKCITWLMKIRLIGSIKGAGTLFFILLVYSMHHKKNLDRIFLVTYICFSLSGLFHPFMEISFINVGQGDAILIRAPFGMSNILVDTGKPSAYKTVDTFLKAKGIRKLDYLILTHMDDDHAGNMAQIIKEYSPKQVITEHVSSITAGPFVLYDLNPIKDENENRSSIMNWFSFNGMHVLLCGDGDAVSEEAIVSAYGSLPVDMIKIGHHGSATSSSDLFLDTMRPELAVISAGSPSLYHHPSDETVQRLLARHIPYINTYEKGDITILGIGRKNILMTSDGMISILSNPASD